jgi:hypothetical protein
MSASISSQSAYLHENGPIYPVIITPSFVAIEALKLEKKDVPFIKVQALFDTGAQTTSVSYKIIDFLKLIPRGSAKVYTSQSNKIVNKYDIALEFDSDMYLNTLRVFSADLQDHSIDCLIGSDVLQFGVFTYDGPAKSFKLSF